MQPAVSVIIPTYNRASLLRKSIQSVLSQTIKDIEIIVINNFSVDKTIDVLNSFDDHRIKVINFSNGGIIARSRNRGMLQSTGRYIAFLDDDDLWYPDKLALELKYMESHPEFGVVYSNARIIDENDNMNGFLIETGRAKEGEVFQYLLRGNFIAILTVLIRREIIDDAGLFDEDPSIIAAEDYEYWMRIASKTMFGYIDRPLALYRVHTMSMSRRSSVALLRQKVLRKLLKDRNFEEKYNDDILANIERLNFSASVYYWSISDGINAKICAKQYILSNLKRMRPLNFTMGTLLYFLIHFDYLVFSHIVYAYENKIAKII